MDSGAERKRHGNRSRNRQGWAGAGVEGQEHGGRDGAAVGGQEWGEAQEQGCNRGRGARGQTKVRMGSGTDTGDSRGKL